MPGVPEPPDPPLNLQEGESVLAAISRECVREMKNYFGRGPTKAKAYLLDDLLFVVMREGMTEAEITLLQAGEADAVRAFRQTFENVMGDRIIGIVEQLTERRVLTYQSQVLFDPELILEIFVFDKPIAKTAAEETARSVLEGDAAVVFATEGDA
jgi:uncharacterized protein YbcI